MRWLFAMLLLFVPAAAATSAEQGPQAIVQQLFADHFAHDMGFSRATVARKRSWLTADLYQQIDAYFRRPAVPDEVPVIDGDPFTYTQEYPSSFAVTDGVMEASMARVPVIMTIGTGRRTVQVLLVRQRPGWRIDDLVYDDGTTFRALLKMQP